MSAVLEWFADPGHAGLANWGVTVFALIVSIAAIVVSRRAQSKQESLQVQLVDIEKAREQDRKEHSRKAQLRAEIVRQHHGAVRHDHLQISNEGDTAAREISSWLEDVPITKHPAIPKNLNEVTEIGPHSAARYVLAIGMGHVPPWKFRVTWQDDSGTPGEYRTTLTV